MHKYIALLAATAIAAPAPAPLKVPLESATRYQPRADGTVDGPAFLKTLNETLQKYSSRSLPTYSGVSNRLKPRAVGEEALTDQVEQGQDELYYGNADVSGQTFTIDFDTGSADFFVPGPKCGSDQGCVGSTKYDQSGTDENNQTSITYGSGAVTGDNYFDTVTVAGLTADHTNVISLTTAQGFANSASEGLMGMGFSTIANSKQPTFFERLMAEGKVTANEFSFYLGRAKSGTQDVSEMTLGGRDASKFSGTPEAVKVTKRGYWQIALDTLKVGNNKTPGSAGQAAIDTGTTIILAPTAAATAAFLQIPGSFPVPLVSGSPAITIFAYPCTTTTIPSIVFGGKTYSINPLDFNFGQLTSDFASLIGSNALSNRLDSLPLIGGGTCLAALAGADLDPSQNLYVVGDSFLKNWYSIYSYENGASVSFAKAVGNQ